MLLNIADIPADGLDLDVALDKKFLKMLIHAFGPGVSGSLKARLKVTLNDGVLNVSGHVSAPLSLECSRCLKRYPFSVEQHFSNTYIVGGVTEVEKELTTEELDQGHIQGTDIDLDEVVVEELLLQAPTKPLCSTDCKGLCSRCGADLKTEGCQCEAPAKIDMRLAKLKDFKVK